MEAEALSMDTGFSVNDLTGIKFEVGIIQLWMLFGL
jgi:hypothetical protein